MSDPRRLVPGQTHFVTRRTSRRTLLLKPTEAVNQVVLYALGLAQVKNPGVRLHGLVVQATHLHAATTDAQGGSELPSFFRDFHSLTARALNAHYGRGECFWRPGSYDNVEVHDGGSLEDQLLYLWANTVKDGLVSRPERWPGVRFLAEDFGRTFRVKRPDGAFFGGRLPEGWEPTYPPVQRQLRTARRHAEEERRRLERERDRARGRGRRRRRQLGRARRRKRRAPRPLRPSRQVLPAEVTVTISTPPGYEGKSLEEVRAHFRALLDQRIKAIHDERQADGLTHFMGVEAILAQDPLGVAGGTFPTFARTPRIASKNPGLRVALLQGLQEWRQAYRAALERWKQGVRDVLFPLGAYWLPRFHKAQLAATTGPPSP